MKRLCGILAGLLCASALSASVKIGPFEVSPEGQIEAGGLSFSLNHADPGWQRTVQQSSSIIKEQNRSSGEEFLLEGRWKIQAKHFQLREHVKKSGEHEITVSLRVSSPDGIPSNGLTFGTTLPHGDFVKEGIRINGKQAGFKPEFQDKNWQIATWNDPSTVVLPLKTGLLTITGDFHVFLQDNRKFNRNHWSLQLRRKPEGGVIREKSYELKMSLKPYQFRTVSLKDSANLDFRDEIAGDGKGGWTDQGSNDMRTFPVRQRNFAGIEFDITAPADNNGRGVIGLFCDPHARSYPKTVSVPVTDLQGRYLYLLHALGWEPAPGTDIGTMEVVYSDGEKSSIPLLSGRDAANFWLPRTRENAAVAWRGENDTALIGIFASRFPVKNKPVRKVSFTSSGKAIWLIAGMTFADDIVPMSADEPFILQAGPDWKPFKSHKMVKKDSILDFSELLDAPAGKYGFIRANNGLLEFEKLPGKPVRLFGGNIAFDVNFMQNEFCDKLGDVMAGMGYNFLRLHHFDQVIAKVENGRSTELEPKPLERMDYLISAMKKRGIYITLDLYILRKLAKGEIHEFPELACSHKQFRAMVFVSESAMKSWEDFSANLLNHVNPYTGLAWKDDPAIAFLNLINENTIFAVVDWDPRVRAVYDAKFREYADANGLRITERNRSHYWRIFLSETYAKGYRRMAEFIRKLGVRVPLTDQNMWSSIPMTLLRNDYDLVDNHFYWQHPEFLGKNWSLPMAVGNSSSITACGGALAEMFQSRLFGKPFTLTEWDYCNPCEYVLEGSLMTGAYAALQDWSGLCHFALSHTAERVKKENTPLGLFDLLNDPQRTLANRAAALLYLRRDVATGRGAYPFLLSTDYLKNGHPIMAVPSVMRRLGLVGRFGVLVARKGTVPALPGGTQAAFGLESCWAETPMNVPFLPAEKPDDMLAEIVHRKLVPPGCIDLEKQIYNSDTGELSLDRKNIMFRVVTPKSEGFSLPAGKREAGNYMTVENKVGRGVFFAASRDGRPLAESRRVLLLHLTDSKNSMSRYASNDFTVMLDWGRLPLLLRRGEAVISLKAPQGLTLYACRDNGERIGKVPFTRIGDRIRFTARNFGEKEAVLVYELTE